MIYIYNSLFLSSVSLPPCPLLNPNLVSLILTQTLFSFFYSMQENIVQDFRNLRDHAEKEGLFQAKPLFFCLHLGHILLLEVLALLLLWTCETNWTSTLLCCVILATSQVICLYYSQCHR